MKLIQANIWGGKLMYPIADFFNGQKPDIVCMQEVHDLKGPSGAIFFSLGELKERCGFTYSLMSPSYVSNYQRRKNPFGNAILSNLPITDSETIFTYGEFNDNFDMTEDDFNVRNLQHAVLDVNGQQLHVLNHHGFLIPEHKNGSPETERQMRLIADYVSKLNGPIILCGDFNLASGSSSIKIIDEVLTGLPQQHGLQSTYVSHFNSNSTVSDYIFVNDLVKVKDFNMSEEVISDHKALILDFDI